MDLVAFILACFGMTNILVYGKIFDPIRPKYHFFHCTMCTGFWVGLVVWYISQININPFLAGCISSGASYFISSIIDDEGLLIKLKNSK